MEIRVKSFQHEDYWYSGKVGQVFKVLKEGYDDYTVERENDNKNYYVKKVDCDIVGLEKMKFINDESYFGILKLGEEYEVLPIEYQLHPKEGHYKVYIEGEFIEYTRIDRFLNNNIDMFKIVEKYIMSSINKKLTEDEEYILTSLICDLEMNIKKIESIIGGK